MTTAERDRVVQVSSALILAAITLLAKAIRERESAPASSGAEAEPYAGRLWIGVTGQPITDPALCATIKKTTQMTLGIRLSPHAFRRAAKATSTLFGGAHPRLAEGVLHHSSARIGEEHYDSMSSRKAALALTAIVRALTREVD